MKEKLRNKKGITLIALVITIIVLLILAGVTIATLTGENGILTKATESKERTTKATAEEMISVVIGGLQTENLGDTSKITPEAIANQVMKDNNIENVVAEGSTFPTNIIFQDDSVKVWVDIDLSIGDNGSYDGIYSEEGLEGKIAPEDLFNYEIIDDGEVAATGLDSLPEKTAMITGIKSEYCNGYGYNPETGENDLDNTHYEIKYDNDVITNEKTLVIPYQVDGKYIPEGIEGEMYKITVVNITVKGDANGGASSLPNIETIIYPNTVENIIGSGSDEASSPTKKQKKIVLPINLTQIPSNFFRGMGKLEKIEIPENVTSIEEHAFSQSYLLKIEKLPDNIKVIEDSAFRHTSIDSITYKGNTYTSQSQLITALESNGVEVGDWVFQYTGLSD